VRFLADESCDFAVVRALRDAGHDVTALAEVSPALDDASVLVLARSEARILLTEDKDFGLLAYAGGQQTAGVILIRFPADARKQLVQTAINVVAEIGDRLSRAFVVVEPGRTRISRPSEKR
jgi:predicted nuclease of predicted toxin-antitoxin system